MHLPRRFQNQASLPWTAPRISTSFDAAKALIENAVNCSLEVVEIIVVLDNGGFGGMTVGCKYSKSEVRVLPNDHDSFFGTLCLAGWPASENLDNFNRGTSLTQIRTSGVAGPTTRRSGIHSSQSSMFEVENRSAVAQIRHQIAFKDVARPLQ